MLAGPADFDLSSGSAIPAGAKGRIACEAPGVQSPEALAGGFARGRPPVDNPAVDAEISRLNSFLRWRWRKPAA